MRRHRLQAISLVFMWVGALEVAASFLAKYWFQYNISFTPWFFAVLILGIALYAATRIF